MTQLLGTLKGAAGTLSGKLRVTLSGQMVDLATDPDTVYAPKPELFIITNGVLNITLPESETSGISYRFEFFLVDGSSNIIEPALIDFYAIIPNLATVQFATLVPTGMVNDVLDTGALRIARIIASDTSLSSAIGGPFPRGNWNYNTVYRYRDLVFYQLRTYICKSINPITGNLPTDTSVWDVIPIEPLGTVSLADPTPFGPAWNNSVLPPSQNALWEKIATMPGLDSPAFTGNATATTQTSSDNSSKIATTSYVKANLANYALLNSPVLTGNPTAPTPATTDNDTSVATTAFVKNVMSQDRLVLVAFNSTQVTATTNATSTMLFNSLQYVRNGDSFSGSSTLLVNRSGWYSFSLSTWFYTTGGTPPTNLDCLIYIGKPSVPEYAFIGRIFYATAVEAGIGTVYNAQKVLQLNAGENIYISYRANTFGGTGFTVVYAVDQLVCTQLA
ncbi:hypothetical protein H6G93_09195 [Nostoc sp. FACHB-973]|nr:hypothetical protein [Nostoc sp. FACHB-973]